ncbi:aminoglycoside phosphotransferase family protein [Cohnella herbarum]|uniref:Aminoglycoside phosphotransferase family protein n=2 Tax=Cohnella herbarum TaxID=2728023 RepID=A0A7Z2VRK2_9BACL|nr:aminoglycoside phosphotransferase family protein [Cohnella herbarum]
MVGIDWIEKSEDELFHSDSVITVDTMVQGFEAEVVKIGTGRRSYVLKVWNKSSKPDIRFQYSLLNVLHERELAVSKPVGWGFNTAKDQALLTTFDGMPFRPQNVKRIAELADILSRIHRMRAEDISNLPLHDFTDYFFPGVSDFPNLQESLIPLVRDAELKQDRLIHGDFHLNNIVEDDGRLTVIDWTNGQLGDTRYDFAWSLLLKRLYVSELYATAFRSAYLSAIEISQVELERFEALACLRWILLNKYGATPGGPDTMKKLKGIVQANPYLKANLVDRA